MVNILQQSEFAQRVQAVRCAERALAEGLGLSPEKEVAASAAAQAISQPGVLVRVGCGTMSEFSYFTDLVERALSGYLVDPGQVDRWDARFTSSVAGGGAGYAEGTRLLREGITFELQNGSGVRVHLDVEVEGQRRLALALDKFTKTSGARR